METIKSKIIIIGAGFGGIATAIRLQQEGENDFIILEKSTVVGGVWRDNVYPGCACDVPSHLYELSFAPNPNWSRRFAPQSEILDYLRSCVEKFKLKEKIRFDHGVELRKWDEAKQKWIVSTNQGTFEAQFVVSAIGFLSVPNIPHIKNLENFKGEVFHSAQWPKDFVAGNKSIAVIGSGSSAVQFIPYLQRQAEKLYSFQRTPAWILARGDRPISLRTRTLLKDFPILQKLWRLKIYWQLELAVLGFMHPGLMKQAQSMAVQHMNKSVQDPELRKKLTPDYVIGCKRIALSDEYFPALAQKNVEVITADIAEMTNDSIIDSEGVERKIDVLVLGTGFKTKDLPYNDGVIGKNGLSLGKVWNESPRAYMGTTVAGFPNLFILQGPNTGLGHSSLLFMIESQITHFLTLLKSMKQGRHAVVEVKESAQENYVAYVDKSSKESVWQSGCRSWYLDKAGRNFSIWPKASFVYIQKVTKVNLDDYEFTGSNT